MIGIIGAMTVEVEGLKDLMTEKKDASFGDLTFTKGKLLGKDVVITVCGEGKVNAAMSAQTMCLMYNPKIIINTGVAGGLADGLKVGDIVIGTSAVEHDMDMSPLGFEKGFICGVDGIYMDCDKNIVEILAESVAECGISYQTGVIASGEQFISDNGKKEWLKATFNATACEMEGGAIGHVCVRNNIPFGIIRAISDGGDDEASLSFPEFAALAAKNSIEVMKKFVEKL